MLIRSRKHFVAGIVMVGSFFAVCIYLLFPMLHDNYGNRLTGLQFADSVFNSLAKGSSYFLPEVRKEIDAVEGKTIEVNVPLEHKYSYGAARVLSIVGAEANYDKEGRLHFKGDLGSILNAAADVGDTLYYNEHKPIEEKYRMPALQVAKCWWSLLHPAIQELQKQGHIEYAKIVDVTLKKAMFKDDKKLWDWINTVKMNTIKRASVTVALLDESGSPVQSWKLTNAWPKKYTVEGFKADGNNVSMETIVLAHEGVTPA